MSWKSIQHTLRNLRWEFLTEASERTQIPVLCLLSIAYQIAAGESTGIIEMYVYGARYIGATEQQIAHARACGAKYRHQILVIARLSHLDEWTTHIKVFREMSRFLESQHAIGQCAPLPDRIPSCVIRAF